MLKTQLILVTLYQLQVSILPHPHCVGSIWWVCSGSYCQNSMNPGWYDPISAILTPSLSWQMQVLRLKQKWSPISRLEWYVVPTHLTKLNYSTIIWSFKKDDLSLAVMVIIGKARPSLGLVSTMKEGSQGRLQRDISLTVSSQSLSEARKNELHLPAIQKAEVQIGLLRIL